MTNQETILKVYWNTPESILAISHGEQIPMDMIPPGITSLKGTPIANQLVVMAKVHDASGKEIGIHTEIEVFPPAGPEFDVYLTVVLPGRGALVVYERKSYTLPGLAEVFQKAIETNTPWQGQLDVVQTAGPAAGRKGVVIAATGEFEGFSGYQQQTATFTYIDARRQTAAVTETFWLSPRK